MPSLLTHYFYTCDLLKYNEAKLAWLKDYEEAFKIGGQGPDPMFFSGLVPFSDFHLLVAKKRFGSKIHKTDGISFIKLLFQKGNLIENENKKLYLSFALGQLSHYFLDHTCHPYVYYFSGFDEKGKLTGKYHYCHANFEAKIDASLAYFFNKKDLIEEPQKVLSIPKEELSFISDCTDEVLEEFFSPEKFNHYYENGVNSMVKIYRFVHKNDGKMGKLMRKNLLGQLLIPRENDRIVLNDDHLTWLHPTKGYETKESFVELYNKALDRFAQVLDVIISNNFDPACLDRFNTRENYSGNKLDYRMVNKDTKQLLYKY